MTEKPSILLSFSELRGKKVFPQASMESYVASSSAGSPLQLWFCCRHFYNFFFTIGPAWGLWLSPRCFGWWGSLRRGIVQAQRASPHSVHFPVWWDVVLGSVLTCVLSSHSRGGDMAQKDPTKFCVILVRMDPTIHKASCSWWVNMQVKVHSINSQQKMILRRSTE